MQVLLSRSRHRAVAVLGVSGMSCLTCYGNPFRIDSKGRMALDMMEKDGSVSNYLFDIDDNLLFLPTRLYLWNAETQIEQSITSGEFATIQRALGLPGEWQAWSIRDATFRDFRDCDGVAIDEQPFIRDLRVMVEGAHSWQGPSWPLLVHAASETRPIALVTARGHAPETIEYGMRLLVEKGLLPKLPPILGIYTVTHPTVRETLGVKDPAMTVPSVKKLAIRDAVNRSLQKYGKQPPHRFGMSDDDPSNIALAISAMRACKIDHPDKRFFVINSNHQDFSKLEIFPMDYPVTKIESGEPLLRDNPQIGQSSNIPNLKSTSERLISGGHASIQVRDITRSIAFYTSTFGLSLKSRSADDWAEIDAEEGFVIRLQRARLPALTSAGVLSTPCLELTVTKPIGEVSDILSSRGLEFLSTTTGAESSCKTLFKDPDGNLISLTFPLTVDAP